MARRLWGCYSVADHLEHRAFVADVVTYDRLVVPFPSSDDLGRWEAHWNPERQQRLLEILGGLAERVEWSETLRKQFAQEWSPGDAALDLAYGATRRIISDDVARKAEAAKRAEGDILAFAVYAKPDRFDREWRLSRILPFVRRASQVKPGAVREVGIALPPDQQQLAKTVVTRLVVPDDGRDDEEVLKRVVDLVSRDDVARRRAEFQELIASFSTTGCEAKQSSARSKTCSMTSTPRSADIHERSAHASPSKFSRLPREQPRFGHRQLPWRRGQPRPRAKR